MATPQSLPTDDQDRPKKNRGNRRSGAVKGTHSGLRRGQLPWRKDGVILERVNLVRTLSAQGYTASMMIGPVNELMRRRGVPEILTETLYDDIRRMRELQAEERAQAAGVESDLREQHIEALSEVKRQAWKAFHSTPDRSVNRSAYLNTVTRVEETVAKLDGTLAPSLTQVNVAVSVEEAQTRDRIEELQAEWRRRAEVRNIV